MATPFAGRLRRSLWVVALATMMTVAPLACGSSLFAEQPSPAPPAETDVAPLPLAIPPQPSEASPTPQTAEFAPVISDPCHPDFWIVSSRTCPQKAGSRCDCVGCCFDYLHYETNCALRGDHGAFQQWLQPGVPVCVVVHGSNIGRRDLLADSLGVYQWVRHAAPHLPLQMVFYNWPSDVEIVLVPQIAAERMGQRAEFNGIYLAHFLTQLPADRPVSLAGHSHGARLIASALHLLGGGCVDRRVFDTTHDRKQSIRTVLTAAAIDHDWLDPGKRYGQALCRTEALLNVRNQTDGVLAIYPLRMPFSRRALGQRGFTVADHCRLGRFNDKLMQLDVTENVGRGHMINHYFCRPEIAAAIVPYLYFAD